MIGSAFAPPFEFLTQNVPLWFALLMAFTSPHLWARKVSTFVSNVVERRWDNDKP